MPAATNPYPALNLDEILKKWQAAVSGGQMSAFGGLYAPNAQLRVPLSEEPIQGREAIQQYETAISSAFPGATLRLSESCISGDTVAAEWEYSGMNTGPLASPDGVLPPTNRRLSLRGASFLRCSRDGAIVEEHRYYDRTSFFQQLGLR